jgi:hypothetical protein
LKEIRTFEGFLDADSEHNQIAPNQYLRAVNFRLDESGRLVSIRGNVLLAHTLPAGNNTCIGAVADEAEKYIVYFLYNDTNDHRILLYYKPTDTFWTVLSGNDLKFSLNSLIDVALINGLLYWTDNLNEPRRINLAAAIKFNHSGASPIPSDWRWLFGMSPDEWLLIRRPPGLPPSIAKKYNAAFKNNFISHNPVKAAFRYTYYDGEKSVLSPYSVSSRLNDPSETYNYITITLSRNEVIRESVRFIELVIYNENNLDTSGQPKAFVVKTWDKKTDPTPITEHNNGTTLLAFDFYNNKTGEALDNDTVVNPFHYVPLRTKTLAILKNRLWLGNNLQGYDTPAGTSLALTLSTGTSTSATLPVYLIHIAGNNTISQYYSGYAVFTPGPAGTGWYELGTSGVFNDAVYDTPGTYPDPLTSADLHYRGASLGEYALIVLSSYDIFEETATNTGTTVVVTGLLASDSKSVFKSLSSYQAGVVFADQALRKCGVVTASSLQQTIPPRTFDYTSGNTIGLNWSLSNTGALTEIPDWAYYYAVVLTRNQKTRYFLQGLDTAPKYAERDSAGAYVFTATSYNVTTTVGVAINLLSLGKFEAGYTYEDGDMMVLIKSDDTIIELPIVAQDGDYVILQKKDLGTLSTYQFEIYKPYKPSTENEPFCEMGEWFPVNNPTLSSRNYSQLSGSFRPDAYIIQRSYSSTLYYAEAMSPNDKYYQKWYTDHGRINIVTKEGQKRLKTEVIFSDVYVQGTTTNGLSAFHPLNQDILPYELGEIMKLQPASKIQEEGNVLLSIGRNQTISLYIGETQVTNSDTSSYFVNQTG